MQLPFHNVHTKPSMRSTENRLPQEIDKSFIFFREYGPVFPSTWHHHPEYELVLITQSTGQRIVGDHIGDFREGDLVFMGPWLPHIYISEKNPAAASDVMAEALVIQFAEHFVGECFWQIPEMEMIRSYLSYTRRGLVITGQKQERIAPLMQEMLCMNGIRRLAGLLTIFDILCSSTEDQEFLASPNFEENVPVSSYDRRSRITEHILKNFDRDLSLEEMASVSNMAQTTFCSYFKKQYRLTFKEYLTLVRVGHACKLLAEGNENIAQVAYLSGFNNISNFNRQFKKIKHISPGDYRKNFTPAKVNVV